MESVLSILQFGIHCIAYWVCFTQCKVVEFGTLRNLWWVSRSFLSISPSFNIFCVCLLCLNWSAIISNMIVYFFNTIYLVLTQSSPLTQGIKTTEWKKPRPTVKQQISVVSTATTAIDDCQTAISVVCTAIIWFIEQREYRIIQHAQ